MAKTRNDLERGRSICKGHLSQEHGQKKKRKGIALSDKDVQCADLGGQARQKRFIGSSQSVVLPLLHFSEVRSNHEFYSLFLFFSSTNLFRLQFVLFASWKYEWVHPIQGRKRVKSTDFTKTKSHFPFSTHSFRTAIVRHFVKHKKTTNENVRFSGKSPSYLLRSIGFY